MFTQPNMYKVVKTHPNPLDVYSKKLLGQKIVTPEEVQQLTDRVQVLPAQLNMHTSNHVCPSKYWFRQTV